MNQLADTGTLPGMATTTGLVIAAVVIVVGLVLLAAHNHRLHVRLRRDLTKPPQ